MLKLIGLLIIWDAVWSLQTQKNRHWFMGDLGRWIRLVCGIYLIWIN